MSEKVVQLIAGICAILLGINVFSRRGYLSAMWGGYIDYGPYHEVIGVIIAIIGLVFVYNGTRSIIRGRRKGQPPRKNA